MTNDGEFSVELAGGLEGAGHRVDKAARLDVVLARSGEVDAVLLDFGAFGTDGFEVCRAIRSASPVPLIVADVSDDEFDRVLSFKLGVDDFIVRPCSARELIARIEAVVRRVDSSWRPWESSVASAEQVHDVGAVRIALRSRTVTAHGREVMLTRKEFDILALLASDPGRVFSREDIMREVWGYDGAGDTRTLGVHMVGIRRKLPSSLVETVRGVGFRLNAGRAHGVSAPEAGGLLAGVGLRAG